MLTAARRDEVVSLRWSEINFYDAIITSPEERAKNRREHIFSLSEPTLAILAAQPPAGSKPTVAHAIPSWDEAARIPGLVRQQGRSRRKHHLEAQRQGASHWTPHDFRCGVSTALHQRFGAHVGEAILGHVGGHNAGVAGVYNKALYLDERRRALRDGPRTSRH